MAEQLQELAQNPTVVKLWDGYLQRHPQAGEPGATPPALWVVYEARD